MRPSTKKLYQLSLAAMFIAIGWLLPFLTGQIPTIGSMLLPMHIPVLLSGFILGPFYGLLIGFITPITRALVFGMPPLYPVSIIMAFELATYGLVSGFLFHIISKRFNQSLFNVLSTLVIAMVCGRIVWGVASYFILSINGTFTFSMFISGAFVTAWPGIVIQIMIIPLIIQLLIHHQLIDSLNKKS